MTAPARPFGWPRGVLPENIARRIQISPTGCWTWTGSLFWDGYGRVWFEGRQQRAHRVTYTLLAGAIPPGLEIDHLCRVRNCVNPVHLEAVTSSENKRRSPLVGKRRPRATCTNGHPWVPENIQMRAHGGRACRICQRAAWARYKARRRDALKAAS